MRLYQFEARQQFCEPCADELGIRRICDAPSTDHSHQMIVEDLLEQRLRPSMAGRELEFLERAVCRACGRPYTERPCCQTHALRALQLEDARMQSGCSMYCTRHHERFEPPGTCPGCRSVDGA